eukprot:TRINITY_DN4926_c1_g4_i1.p1 TRINITY_DN4926_c1_g4~~TRINITY_DN4926_c1_g4_i1.p1  ORF type:complete len:210 (+),score=25.17 TRINITY_DN4926_c1_g4_i1:114-743(+)
MSQSDLEGLAASEAALRSGYGISNDLTNSGEITGAQLKQEIQSMMVTVQSKMDERQRTLLTMQERLKQLHYARETDSRECTAQMMHLRATIAKLTELVEFAHQQQTQQQHHQQQQINFSAQQPQVDPWQQQQQQQHHQLQQQQYQQQQQHPSAFGAVQKRTRDSAPTHCHHCGMAAQSLSLCGGCRKVAFCDRKCQLDAWPNHRTTCQA